ncbi:MAG: hypothetical protein ACFB0B_04465 [Thermonemataceae bacterium]
MKTLLTFTIVTILFVTGCVPVKKYEILNEDLAVAQAQLKEAKATIFIMNEWLEEEEDNSETEAIAAGLKQQAIQTKKAISQRDAIIYRLRNQIKVLENKIYVLERKKQPKQIPVEKKQKNSY